MKKVNSKKKSFYSTKLFTRRTNDISKVNRKISVTARIDLEFDHLIFIEANKLSVSHSDNKSSVWITEILWEEQNIFSRWFLQNQIYRNWLDSSYFIATDRFRYCYSWVTFVRVNVPGSTVKKTFWMLSIVFEYEVLRVVWFVLLVSALWVANRFVINRPAHLLHERTIVG